LTTDEKPYQWLAWIGTVFVLVSAFMASRNFYPWYAYGYIISNCIWIVIGFLWKEKTIITINTGVNIIYIAGLYFS
jgi:hypothetical protein